MIQGKLFKEFVKSLDYYLQSFIINFANLISDMVKNA